MSTTQVNRDALVKKLAHEVTFTDDPPYEELEAALGSLVDAISAGKSPGSSPDWAAIVSEAIQLRPRH